MQRSLTLHGLRAELILLAVAFGHRELTKPGCPLVNSLTAIIAVFRFLSTEIS